PQGASDGARGGLTMAFGAFSSGAAPGVATGQEGPRRKSRVALFLLLPGIAYLALFFLVPLISLLLTSFMAPREFVDIGQFDYAFRWENYLKVVDTYLPHILRSFGYAAVATVLALIIGYPLAYFIGVHLR